MKILQEKYPKGTLKGQKSDGRYIDGYLYRNLQILAKKIVEDMTFLGVIYSSTYEVGTGKSVLATQIGETWSYIMKKEHNVDVPFSIKNIVFRPEDLIERSFEVPKYSFLLLDEWEDAHYWSKLGITLRQFFRKCRQLNLFIMIIIPNWFQLPLGYAVSRSVFAIDVKFNEGFERGYYSFYSFPAKRKLYIEGKRTYNYYVVKPDFNGAFTDGYGVPRKVYLEAKRKDMEHFEDTKYNLTMDEIELNVKREIIAKLRDKWQGTKKDFAEGLGISTRTLQRYYNKGNKAKSLEKEGKTSLTDTYSNKPIEIVPIAKGSKSIGGIAT